MIYRQCLLAVLLICGIAAAEIAPQEVKLDDLQSIRIIGKLGVPIGDVTVITGVIVDGSLIGDVALQTSYLVKVTSVNGKGLSSMPMMSFSKSPVCKSELPSDIYELYKKTYGKELKIITQAESQSMNLGYVGKEVRLVVAENIMVTGISLDKKLVIPSNRELEIWQDCQLKVQTQLLILDEIIQ